MALTININDLTLCHRGSDGISHNTLPDVCKTPDKGIPLPYQNEAYSRDLVKGTTSVFADGGHSIAKYGSQFSKSVMDEGGSMGGVVSGTNKAETDWITHSFSVFFEGQPACRLTDKLFMNHRNTVNMAGLKQRDLPPEDQAFYDEICRLACQCLAEKKGLLKPGETYQDCVRKKIDKLHYDKDLHPNPDSTIWREVPYDRGNNWELIKATGKEIPTSNYIRGNSRRLDIVRVDEAMKPKTFMDMKFGNDKLTSEARKDYEKIAERYTGSRRNFQEFKVEDKCDCFDPYGTATAPVTSPTPAPAPEDEGLLERYGRLLKDSTGIELAKPVLAGVLVLSVLSRFLFPPRNVIPI